MSHAGGARPGDGLATRRLLAIVGFGRLGRACAAEVVASTDFALAGVVCRPGAAAKLPAPFARLPVVEHVRDLGPVLAALLCVPPADSTDAACELLEAGVPVVECARLEGRALAEHYAAIAAACARHRVPAVVGAGWDPGLLQMLQRLFEFLVPQGRTSLRDRPGAALHHTEAARNVEGVADALVTELRGPDGRTGRYVYVELAPGASVAAIEAAFRADPLFAGESTQVFAVDSVAMLEAEGHGVLLERRGTADSGAHQNLLLEGRFDRAALAARTMLDGVRRLGGPAPGMRQYADWK
ncbi:MAG: hypothetical protein JSW68_10355 [Burkholderiales bacterium]|nr:MAG: hypothetical protein JSW68_10355 [Burkholderiales bacterium]